MATIVALSALFCLAAGVAVLWANPQRATNRLFSLTSLFAAAWLWCVVEATRSRLDPGTSLMWVRWNGVASALLLWSLWLLRGWIVLRLTGRRLLRKTAPVLVLTMGLCALCFTEWYYAPESTFAAPSRGPLYYALGAAGFCVAAFLTGEALRGAGSRRGIERFEILFLTLNLSVAFIFISAFTVLGNVLALSWLRRSSFAVFVICYALAAWAVMFHRIYTPRQILLSLCQRLVLLALVGMGVVACWSVLQGTVAYPADFLLSIALAMSLGWWMDRKIRAGLDLDGERALTLLRQQTIEIARTEPDAHRLCERFECLLQHEYGAPRARLINNSDDLRLKDAPTLSPDQPGYAAMCGLAWATPESLERQRPTAAIQDLQAFLHAHAFGVVVAAPRGSPAPTLFIALGVKDSGWPYTYPEVQRLQAIAELMDNILTRSRLTTQAALQAKIQHLAMMSRGLAHDLKNLITPISSFLVHTTGRYEPGSAEEEVHTAAKRAASIITDYIREAHFFASRLTPRFELVPVARVLQSAAELTAARAAQRGVVVRAQVLASGEQIVADAVLLQRLFVNLLHNAIDALSGGGEVELRCNRPRSGWIRFEVVDAGPGIPAADVKRVFEPYFTTKQFGDDIRGFGLGLTICQKIAQLHRGVIQLDSELGRGTTVTVELPVTQPEPLTVSSAKRAQAAAFAGSQA